MTFVCCWPDSAHELIGESLTFNPNCNSVPKLPFPCYFQGNPFGVGLKPRSGFLNSRANVRYDIRFTETTTGTQFFQMSTSLLPGQPSGSSRISSSSLRLLYTEETVQDNLTFIESTDGRLLACLAVRQCLGSIRLKTDPAASPPPSRPGTLKSAALWNVCCTLVGKSVPISGSNQNLPKYIRNPE